jgi:hypothetical protein
VKSANNKTQVTHPEENDTYYVNDGLQNKPKMAKSKKTKKKQQ